MSLRDWPMDDLLAELDYQQRAKLPGTVTTWGTGPCGHHARGSGVCAACLQAEIERRGGRQVKLLSPKQPCSHA